MLQVGCSCCYVACVASVVARCVRAVVAWLALDSLVVVSPVWRTVVGKSKCGAPGHLRRIWGLRCAVGLAGAFWRVFPERCLGGSGGGSPRIDLRFFCSSAYCGILFKILCRWVVGLCILVKVLPKIALYRFWQRFFPGVLCVYFGPPLCCSCGSKCAVWLGCVLVRFSQDGSWRFRGRFSPKLPCVCFGCRCSLSLSRDELLLLPVGLFVLQSAWAFLVKTALLFAPKISAVLVGLRVSPWFGWFASFLVLGVLSQMVVW
ncbi:hypothetical protein Taro_028028 [Colocasia esculenta]|uniref:Uncharacterized protein n=1 Tax=Colocasia esculenta TaxID=4460 RepID=A0A843VJT2_COLES|nr:hypothetical protein [Colocasia esculenta]